MELKKAQFELSSVQNEIAAQLLFMGFYCSDTDYDLNSITKRYQGNFYKVKVIYWESGQTNIWKECKSLKELI